MRTTITIDDRLFEDVKKRASERGSTVSRVIEESVRLALRVVPGGARQERDFELVTYGHGGQFTTSDVDKVSSLIERADLEEYGKQPD